MDFAYAFVTTSQSLRITHEMFATTSQALRICELRKILRSVCETPRWSSDLSHLLTYMHGSDAGQQ